MFFMRLLLKFGEAILELRCGTPSVERLCSALCQKFCIRLRLSCSFRKFLAKLRSLLNRMLVLQSDGGCTVLGLCSDLRKMLTMLLSLRNLLLTFCQSGGTSGEGGLCDRAGSRFLLKLRSQNVIVLLSTGGVVQ